MGLAGQGDRRSERTGCEVLMSNLIVCSVRDSAVNAYMRPFYVQAVGAAMRGFGDEVNNAGSEMNKHPGDYELYELGEFDEETGYIKMLPEPRMLARASDVKLKENQHETVQTPKRQ